jgi:DNA-binding transcriptional LysR family regulator
MTNVAGAHGLEWDDLRYVLALHRAHTLSAAAEALASTHTTIGRRLRAIEERLGVRLFDRTPEGYVATPAGDDVARVAARLEEDVLALEARVLGRDVRLEGELRVATMEMLLRHHHTLFASFVAKHPSVQLTVCASDREVSLVRREADVALRLTGSPPEGLVGRRVGRLEFAVYASRALARRIARDQGSREQGARRGESPPLASFPWLGWDLRLGTPWLDGWLAQRAPGARIVARFDVATSAWHDLVAQGLGVHFLPTNEGDSDRRLVRVSDVATEFGRDLWLLTLPELRTTPRVRAFLDHAAATLTGAERAPLATKPKPKPKSQSKPTRRR